MDNNEQTWLKDLPYLPALTVFCGKMDIDTLGCEISRKYRYVHKICDISVDSVREVIKNCYTVSYPMVYIFPHVEKMSLNAINSLLKITEEPPNASLFVLTVDRIDNLISTIRSRAVVIDPVFEKLEFSKTLEDFCSLVYTNIDSVPLTNALKISNRIKLKETDDDKFELLDFLMCMREIYSEHFKAYGTAQEYDLANKMVDKYLRTEIAIHQLNTIRGVRKDDLLDEWIIKIRGVDTDEKEYSRNSN